MFTRGMLKWGNIVKEINYYTVQSANSVHEYFPDITRHSVWCSHEFYQTK